MSNFKYCPLVWHFCGEVNTEKIEKIQERALRFIFQDCNSSYDTLLGKSQLPSLKVRRLRAIALEAFKILNNQTHVYLSDLLTYKFHSYSFSYTNTVEIRQVRTSTYSVRSFRSTAANILNSLPQKFRDITSAKQFRSQTGTWSGGGSAHAHSAQTVNVYVPGRVAQSVTCLATDACLTADPGVTSSIPARSHTFVVEIDHEIISTVILLLPLIYSRRVVVSYKRKYVHELLVNRLFKPAQEKVWLGELTVPQ